MKAKSEDQGLKNRKSRGQLRKKPGSGKNKINPAATDTSTKAKAAVSEEKSGGTKPMITETAEVKVDQPENDIALSDTIRSSYN